MVQPFLSIGAYKGLTVVGIIATILFTVALYFAFLKVQRFRVEQKLNELADDKDQNTQDASRWSKPPLLMQVHGPAFSLVIGWFLVGLFFVTFGASSWALLAGFALLCCTSLYNNHTYGNLDWRKGDPMLYVIGVIACTFFLYTSMSFTNTSFQMQRYAHYTYEGPMAVVGVGSYLNGIYYYDEYSSCPVEMNMATMQVTWTCPEMECFAEVNSPFCNALVCTASETTCELDCSDDDQQAAHNESLACLERNYNKTFIQLNSGGDDDDQNNQKDQNDDGDWSYDDMYGDCDSCSAEYAYIVDGDRYVKNAYGYGATIFFLVVSVLSGAWWVFTRRSLEARQNDSKHEELMANETAVVT